MWFKSKIISIISNNEKNIEKFKSLHIYNQESSQTVTSTLFGTYEYTTWKCLVADGEDLLSNAAKSDRCENYKGSTTSVSFFKIIDSSMSLIYPFDGLNTEKEAKDFCESQGGQGSTFGHDDFDIMTKGKKVVSSIYIICIC